MKHSQYENWILDDRPLTKIEYQDLFEHTKSCKSCQELQAGWKASKLLLSQVQFYMPADGFTIRWQTTMNKKCHAEKVQRYRLITIGVFSLALVSSMLYLFVSGSFVHLFANLFNFMAGLFFTLTNGLASFGYAINRLPVIFPMAIGFVFFGFINAFFIASMFTLWNLKQRDLVINEITIH